MVSESLFILLDGYNLLFGSHSIENGLKENREALIQKLALSLKLALTEATIIFDAPTQDSFGSKGHLGPLEIIFTEKEELADDFILKKIKASKKPHLYLVVTSDRKLGERARRMLAKVIPPKKWWEELQKKATKVSKEKKKPSPKPLAPSPKKLSLERNLKNEPAYYLEAFEKGFRDLQEESPPMKKEKSKKTVRKTRLEKKITDYERWLRAFEKKLKE